MSFDMNKQLIQYVLWVVQQDSEVCALRILNRLEEDMDSRTKEKVTYINDMMQVLAGEISEV